MSLGLVGALMLVFAAQAGAQTLTARPGPFTGETTYGGTDPEGHRITGTSRPGAFKDETVMTLASGDKTTHCVTRPGHSEARL